MSTVTSIMNTISYDHRQWMLQNAIDNDNTHTHSVDDDNTLCDIDESIANHYRPINNLCVCLIDSDEVESDRYFSFTNVMSNIDICKQINVHDTELREKILKHKKSSSFGFSALQKRIEKVKSDLKNLTNKLNSSKSGEENDDTYQCYNNLALGNALDDDDGIETEEISVDKTWKCPSQFNSNNPFSELSESTQKVLGRLNFTAERSTENDEIEMEEDELDLSFTNQQNSYIRTCTSKGTLSIIDEQDEDDYSSDESESVRSAVIERIACNTDNTITPKSCSLHSFDITDSDSYDTPLSSFRVSDRKQESIDDTDEYFSDCAKCSESSYSSRESLRSREPDKLGNSGTEETINADNCFEQIFENCQNLQDRSSSSTKSDEAFGSEAEYDNSCWSTEDIPQSIEQSDSLYDKPYQSMLKASLPDLLESSDGQDTDHIVGSLVSRHFNKSTDLDEILDLLSPHRESSPSRLSQSLCNLFTNKSSKIIHPDDFFNDKASFDNLLETDLDSGYMSIYKPVTETEIPPKVDFSCSMGNVNELDNSLNGLHATLINRLRQKAGSVTELRIADSLCKLNLPTWLHLPDDRDECDRLSDESSRHNYSTSLPPIQYSLTSLNSTLYSSQRRQQSLPPPIANNSTAVVNRDRTKPVVLPSQILRQTAQSKLTPIKFCQARQVLLPNKVVIRNSH